ncbi:MAG: hypothetical protein HOL70_16905, partial [Candidatus Marinimicrobia bacterium]|nr:hypothetical protein [Candidatus Neomarinimicrobiota bacterium]
DQATIQAGIDAAVDGDTVLVEAGLYYETIDFIGKNIVLLSSSGPSSTIIDGTTGGDTTSVVNMSSWGFSADCIIDGFTIQNGLVGISASPDYSNPTLTIHNCIITNTGTAISGHFLQRWEISKTLVVNNDLGFSKGYYGDSSVIINCTFDNSIRDIAFNPSYGTTSELSIYNSIFRNQIDGYETNPVNMYYCDYADGSLAANVNIIAGNITNDPLFVDPINDDYNLQAGSPCIDSGDPLSPRDQDGSRADIGARPSDYGDPYPISINIPSDYTSIQEAIDASFTGDTVLVQPGIYFENINFNGKNIVVGSLYLTTADSSYISSTIVNANYAGSVVNFNSGETSSASLIGLTLINGSATQGGGIYCDNASPTLDHLIIRENTAYDGGGIFTIYSANPLITNTQIYNNTATSKGGGIATSTASNPTLKGTLIYNNSADYGGGIYSVGGSPSFSDLTIVDNTANHGGAITCQGSANVSIINTIMRNNASKEIFFLSFSMMNISYSNIDGGQSSFEGDANATISWGAGIIDEDPKFGNDSILDFRLLANSLNINAGHPDSTDEDGTRSDIGALNYYNTYTGTNWYVSEDGDDISGSGEEINPFASIQGGINFSQEGNSILVNPGTYQETIDYINKEIHVVSQSGAALTIIDGGGNGPVVKMWGESTEPTLRGFTIQNGSAHEGGGLDIYCNGVIDSCIITDNETPTYFGGGAYVHAGTPT